MYMRVYNEICGRKFANLDFYSKDVRVEKRKEDRVPLQIRGHKGWCPSQGCLQDPSLCPRKFLI